MISRLSAAALLSVVLAGCAGTEVKGIVRDEDSGQPLPGAIVRVGGESTRTGPGGFYELEIDVEENKPEQVMVGAPGYEPKSMLMTFDDDQDTIYSDIELKKEFSEREFRRRQQEIRLRQQELQLQQQQQEQLQQQQQLQRHEQQAEQIEPEAPAVDQTAPAEPAPEGTPAPEPQFEGE